MRRLAGSSWYGQLHQDVTLEDQGSGPRCGGSSCIKGNPERSRFWFVDWYGISQAAPPRPRPAPPVPGWAKSASTDRDTK